ncbi:MAG: oligopeptide/dipeptide ABC transporter ATP-binding protein [Pseudomonadota bacterium]
MALLEIDDLNVMFETGDGTVHAVNGVSLNVDSGQSLAIVGESGSGKSQTAFAVLGLLARNGGAEGSVRFDGTELLGLTEAELNKVRANQISMIFQDPMTSLNPYMRVSDQMTEVLRLHRALSRRDAVLEAVRLLDAVKIPDAKSRVHMYPHEFSGGMRQRVMIAMSLLCRPRLLIADEPTTALDVTVQAQIMALLREVQAEFGTAIILITHDLGIVAGASEETVVLYGGRIMESGPTDQIFAAPSHPYTLGLLEAVPRLDRDDLELRAIPGDPPNMLKIPPGCPFSPRCRMAAERCSIERPPLERHAEGRLRACHRAGGDVAREVA